MPVWQGQGYNSGMRDASNLAWKLALVVKGLAGPSLLDTYEVERRDHAKAMIDLSVLAGHVLAPPKRWQGTLRDGVSWLLNYLPPVKRYFLEMRFKPMPKYTKGVVVSDEIKNSPVGRMFIQPQVELEDGRKVLLDEVIGANFAVLSWGSNPKWGLTQEQIAAYEQLGTRFIQVLPAVQLKAQRPRVEGVISVGDFNNSLKTWFAQYPASVVVLRPDRFIASLCIPQTLGKASTLVLSKLSATPVAVKSPAQSEVA